MFPCPCCGFGTLPVRGPGTRQRCPVCYWFDYELVSTYDRWELWEAQATFEKLGASAPEYLDRTRPPTPQELRDPCHAIDDAPERLRITLHADAKRKVQEAFADVGPFDRITLGEAYRGEMDFPGYPWEWHDRDEHWWDIPDDVLDKSTRQAGIFSHGNYASCLYYIAAYIMKDLRTHDHTGLFAVTCPRWHGLNGETASPESLLTPTQRAAVVAFLRYMGVFAATDFIRDIANRAIPRFESSITSGT